MRKYKVSACNISSINGLINKFLRSCKNGVRTGYIVRCRGLGANGIDRKPHDYMRLCSIVEAPDGNINIDILQTGDVVKFYGGDKIDICIPNREPFRIERCVPSPLIKLNEYAEKFASADTLTFLAYMDSARTIMGENHQV